MKKISKHNSQIHQNEQEPKENKNASLRALSPKAHRPPSPKVTNREEPLNNSRPAPNFEPKNITFNKATFEDKEIDLDLEKAMLVKSKQKPSLSSAKSSANANILKLGICVTDPKKLIPQPECFEEGIQRIRIFRRWHQKSALCNALSSQLRETKPKERPELIQKIKKLKKELCKMGWQDKKSYNEDTYFTNAGRDGQPLLPPQKSYYYKEYVFGETPADLQRFVVGEKGDIYYTPDHYETFYYFGQL